MAPQAGDEHQEHGGGRQRIHHPGRRPARSSTTSASPCSARTPATASRVEINTVRAKQAYLTFDKKLGKNEKEFGGRRIVAAEADRRTSKSSTTTARRERDDDLHLNIDKGPLYYDEAKRLIWTDDDVHVEDDENQPPTDIRGQGMEVHLAAAEARRGRSGRRRAASRTTESFHRRRSHRPEIQRGHEPVRRRRLSFEPAGAERQGRRRRSRPPRRRRPTSTSITPGRFEYEFRKDGDVARFDVPEADPAHPAKERSLRQGDPHTPPPEGKGPLDQLVCQHLELRLPARRPAPAPDDDAADHGLQIESAHAVARRRRSRAQLRRRTARRPRLRLPVRRPDQAHRPQRRSE